MSKAQAPCHGWCHCAIKGRVQVLSPQTLWNNSIAVMQLWLLNNAVAQSVAPCIFRRNACDRKRGLMAPATCFGNAGVAFAWMAWSDCSWMQLWQLLFSALSSPLETVEPHPTVAADCVFSVSHTYSHWLIFAFHQPWLDCALTAVGTACRVVVASDSVFI